jgi:hypothetical protein
MVNVGNKEKYNLAGSLNIIIVIIRIRQWLLCNIMTGKFEMMTKKMLKPQVFQLFNVSGRNVLIRVTHLETAGLFCVRPIT